MIDPAILRPGRLDVKIKIERPDAEAAQDIYSKYLTEFLPVHADDLAEFDGDRSACIKAMIEKVVDRMYAEIDDNRFLEVTYANGDKEVMYFKDFNWGDDPERRRPSQEERHQIGAGDRPTGTAYTASARFDRRRVRRERGFAQHHQPR